MAFQFIVNTAEVARALGAAADQVQERVREEVENLSVSAQDFIVEKAQRELSGYFLEAYLGADNQNLTWNKIDNSIWVVELDESARHIEEGTERRFMDWLLDKNPNAHTAKDGSRYAVIPMPRARFKGPGQSSVNAQNPALASMVRAEMKRRKISLTKIDKNADDTPKLGVLHKFDPPMPGGQDQFPSLYSMPRSEEMAELTGLKPHGGIPLVQGTAITQRIGKKGKEKGKLIREAVVFRVISSKHKAEGRWFAPAIPVFGGLQAAYDNAVAQWPKVVEELQKEFAPKS